MSLLGTTNVWFLDGRDSATNNVLIALGLWPSGAVLEQIICSRSLPAAISWFTRESGACVKYDASDCAANCRYVTWRDGETSFAEDSRP